MNQLDDGMISGQASPSRAIDWPATRAALGNRRLLLWLCVLLSAACGPLAVVLTNKFDQPGIHGAARAGRFLILPVSLIFVFGLMFSLTFLWINRRRRRALERHPWTRWPINYITTGRYEWVQLLDANRQPMSSLILSTWARDIGKLVNHQTPEVWFAGDPRKFGVISLPGGADLRYAYYSAARKPPEFAFHEPVTTEPEHSDTAAVPSQYEMERIDGQVRMKRSGDQPEEQKPKRHGAIDDPDYPSPRKLRRALGFVLDMLIHIAAGAAVSIATAPEPARYALLHRDWHGLGPIPVLAVLYFVAASFVDRVIIQAIFRTTIGKAVFGLITVRPDTGQRPSFGRLLGVWLMDLWLPIGIAAEFAGNGGSATPDRPGDYFLTAVRWRDLHALNLT